MIHFIKKKGGMKMRRDRKFFLILFILLGSFFYFNQDRQCYGADVISIGMAPDITGRSSEVSIPWMEGIKDYFRYINDQGGINGSKIDLTVTDCQKEIVQEVAAYKRYLRVKSPVMFFNFDTGAALTISKMAAKDKVVQMAGSMAGTFGDASKRPYSFLVGTNYERQIEGLFDYGVLEFKGKGDKPTFAVGYPDTTYGKFCANMCNEILERKKLKKVESVIVATRILDARVQMAKIMRANPDFFVLFGTEPTIANVMKDAQRVGISFERTRFLVPINALSRKVITLGGEVVESLVGASPFSDWNDTDVSGIQLIQEVSKKYHPEITYQSPWYVYGFSSAMIVAEGLKRIPKNQEISGESLKEALLTLNKFDCMGLISPTTYTATDHSGGRGVKLFSPNVKKNILEPVTDWIYID